MEVLIALPITPMPVRVLPVGGPAQSIRCSAFHQTFISTQTGSTVTKDELRAELERQEQRYKEVYGGAVTTYAAQPEPERKAWRKRPTVQDQVFQQELKKMEEELKTEEP